MVDRPEEERRRRGRRGGLLRGMLVVVISLVVALLLLGLVDGMLLFAIVGDGDCIWLSAFFIVSSLLLADLINN